VFGAMITAQQAQLLNDRGGLLTNPGSLPQLNQAVEHGAGGLLPIYQKLTQEIAATSYANAFLAVAGLCAVGVLLALLLRSGPPKPAAPVTPPAPAVTGREVVAAVPARAASQELSHAGRVVDAGHGGRA
jgi:hypothetical protein